MPIPSDALPDNLKKGAESLSSTKDALEGMKGKLGVMEKIGGQLKELKESWSTMDKSERLKKIGGIAAMATLGWIFKKEDAEYLEKGAEEAEESETLDGTDVEEEFKQEKKEAKKKLSEKEYKAKYSIEEDESLSVKQSLTNMYAIRYYNENGELHKKPNKLAQICKQEKAIPSLFILKKSRALFKEGVGSFDYFRKNVADKLVDKSVKDPKERERQAAVILSCCAIGRFQIVPNYYFMKMGWPTRGSEGLKAMYEFIRSNNRQIAIFRKHIQGKWNEYKDMGLLAVSYYAGSKTAEAYKKNPTAEWATKAQFGGHGSIHGYAEKARKNFANYKKKFPGLKDVDYAALCLERNESGKGGLLYEKASQGVGISDVKINDAPIASNKQKGNEEEFFFEKKEGVAKNTKYNEAEKIFKEGTREQKDALAKKFGYPTLSEVKRRYENMPEGNWTGDHDHIQSNFRAPEHQKQTAFTLDICSCYGEINTKTVVQVIDKTMQKDIPVTFFVTGVALTNPRIRQKIQEASKHPNIQIANHGYRHRPLATSNEHGEKWGQKTTGSIEELYDEVIGGAVTIQSVTGKKPKFLRSATLWTSEKGARIAQEITGAKMLGVSKNKHGEMSDAGGSRNSNKVMPKLNSGDIFLGHAKNSHILSTMENIKNDGQGSYIVNNRNEKVYISNLKA